MKQELKLYEIAQQYQAVEALADDLPDEVIKDTLESLGGELQEKVVNIAKFIRNVEASADTILEAAELMVQRAGRMRKMTDRIKAYTLLNMNLAGVTKVTCPHFEIAVRKNPESVNIADDAQIPAHYMVTPETPPPRPDKVAIKQALKNGLDIPGCWLTQGEHLRITV